MLPAAALRTGQEAITLTEIELKLSAAPGDLPALMQALEGWITCTSTRAPEASAPSRSHRGIRGEVENRR